MDKVEAGEPRLAPKLLCVEDDPTVLASVERLLSRDFQVITARSVPEAVLRLDENPDVAIVLADYDLNAPAVRSSLGDARTRKMNGLEFLAQVQTKAPDAVRALFSGHIDLHEMVNAINTSLLHRFILKPWNNEYFRIQMIEALANHSTLREKRALENLSTTDAVTGAKNHRYFQMRLKFEFERSLRHLRPLSMLMIDVDCFKTLNDQHGHPAGDLILKTAALRLQDQVRGIDSVARYGGDEFAVVLPETDAAAALAVAERIRLIFDRGEIVFPKHPPIHCTISVGVATFDPSLNATNVADPAALISRADGALYQAKRQGRNQTVGA